MTTPESKLPAKTPASRVANPFDRLQHQIDRVFSDFSSGMRWPEIFAGADVDVLPSTEVHHGDKAVTITCELPGVAEDEIDIAVADDTVTISGEKKSETEHKNGDYFRTERAYGSFCRSVSLPFDIDADAVKAKFKDGVLSLTIPKPAETKTNSRKVTIQH